MTSLAHITLEVTDVDAAEDFYRTAFGLDGRLRLAATEAPSSGFRGFTLSLVVAQPADVDALAEAAVAAGATLLKPPAKSLWGYGGVVQAPDGTVWQLASSAKKNTGPASRNVREFVLLLGVEDVKAAKQFYVGRGLAVAKSFGSKYVEFDAGTGPVKLALYKRRGLAKVAGVSPEGSGSHRVLIGSDAGPFTDPDGFAWTAAAEAASR
ncbi:glyoxalase [Streptomyces sp. NPDC055952]|uniref:glyoxalase n=1 Tax=Streptomyces sp. NPDC055952 TaxID=3345663 RepID=UPI0035D80C33